MTCVTAPPDSQRALRLIERVPIHRLPKQLGVPGLRDPALVDLDHSFQFANEAIRPGRNSIRDRVHAAGPPGG